MTVMTTYQGNLAIETADQAKRYQHVERVTGSLYIYAKGASLPGLTSVGHYLFIGADGASLPGLTSVGDALSIRAEGVSLPVLTSVGSGLYIEGASLPALSSVGGELHIEAEGTSLPVLASVGGYLSIYAEGTSLPVLASVGGFPATLPPIYLHDNWNINILDAHMIIGCQKHSLAEWEAFDDRQIAAMDGQNALRWWRENKERLLMMARNAGRSFAVSMEVQA